MEGHDGGVRCGGRTVTDLRFADDIDMLEEDEESLKEVTRRLEITSKRYGMEISTEKSKVMVTGKNEMTENQVVNVTVDGVQLGQVKSFTYLGARIDENGKSEIVVRVRIGRATSALAKMDNIWRAREIKLKTKLVLMRAVVVATLLYACESWTVSKGDEKRLRAFEMKTYRRLLGISWKDKKTNEWVMARVTEVYGQELEGFAEMVKKRKLKFYGHEVRRGGLLRAVIEGRTEGRRGRGRPQGNWQENLKDWSGKSLGELKELAKDRERWKDVVFKWVHPRPIRPRR